MRLDAYLVAKSYFRSRERAKEAILKGECLVNGKPILKASFLVEPQHKVFLLQPDFEFVSRGGLKLDAALKNFQLDVTNYTALDVGTATGGFTDCLLRRGSKLVFALDIGKGQLDEKLKNDPRVIFMNNMDIRKVTLLDFQKALKGRTQLIKPQNIQLIFPQFDLIVVDVSFISVTSILEALKNIAKGSTQFIFLIKPQFEYGKKHEGVIRDQVILQEILKKTRKQFHDQDFTILSEIPSPILGKEGNQEFLWYCIVKS